MQQLTVVLYVLVGTLAVLMFGIAYGSYRSAEFASFAPGLIVAMVTPLVTAISGLAGLLISRGVGKALREDAASEDNSEGG